MNDLRATARFAEREPRSSLVLATLRETAVMHDVIRHTGVLTTVRETATVVDRADGQLDNVLRESAVLAGRASGVRRITTTVRELARVRDRLVGTRREVSDLREMATVVDCLHNPAMLFDLVESAGLLDRVTIHVTRKGVTRDTARIRDRLEYRILGDARESAVTSGSSTIHVRHRPVLRETARLSGRADITGALRDTVRDRAHIRDRLHTRTVHRPVTRERAFISDRLEEAHSHAWTANTQTFGMSRYEDFPFESMAGGFAAGLGGMYVRTDAPVGWTFKTGKLDFGTPVKKRLGYVYGLGTHDEPLGLTVGGDVRGRWVETEYIQMEREADDDRAVRCTVGRGYYSNLFDLRFSGDAEFVMHRAEGLLHDGQRRI